MLPIKIVCSPSIIVIFYWLRIILMNRIVYMMWNMQVTDIQIVSYFAYFCQEAINIMRQRELIYFQYSLYPWYPVVSSILMRLLLAHKVLIVRLHWLLSPIGLQSSVYFPAIISEYKDGISACCLRIHRISSSFSLSLT